MPESDSNRASDVTDASPDSDGGIPEPDRDVLPGGGAPFKTLLDSMNAGAVVFDADLRVTYVNEAAWRLFQVDPQDLEYRPDGLADSDPITLDESLDAVRDRIVDPDPYFRTLRRKIRKGISDGGHVTRLTNGTVIQTSYIPVQADASTIGHLVLHRDITQQHLTRRALQESEKRWRRLVEEHPGPIYVTVDGRFQYVNPATVRLFGAASAEDLEGRNVLEFAHPDVRDRIRERRDRLTDDRQPTEPFEHRSVRLDGEVRRIVVRSVPIRFRGQPAAQTMVRDVTEQRRVEAELRDLSDLYRALLEKMPAEVALFGSDGRLEFTTEVPPTDDVTHEDLVGRTMAEMSDLLVGDEDVLQRCSQAIDRVLTSGDAVRHEQPFPTATGEVRDVLRIYTPLLEDGDVERVLAFGVDITDQKTAERELRDLKELYEDVVSSMPVELALFTADGELLFANAKTPDWLDRDAHIGQTLSEISEDVFGTAEAQRPIREAIDQAVEREEVIRFDSPATAPDDDRHYLRVVAPSTVDGEVRRVLTFHLDITDRHRAEKQLQASKQDAEAALESKEQFFSAVTHELRTPLHAILGTSDLLADTSLSEEQERFLGDIRSAAASLLRLFRDILEISRVGSGRIQFQPEPFSPSALVDGVLHTMQDQADDRGNELILSVDESVADSVVGDPTRIKQILWNLLSNAIGVTTDGTIRVRVESADIPPAADRPPRDETAPSTPEPNEATWIAFSVSDDGPGIPESDRDKIFESFVQTQASSVETDEGTGLGLAIVRSLTRRLGGTIDLDTTVGEGSTFTVRLPFEAETDAGEETAQTQAPAPPPTPSSESATLEDMEILVVEDTFSNRRLLDQILVQAGAKVTAVASGSEALDVLETARFDAIIMDIQLPGMDGLETTRRVREDLGRREVPIIGVSASTNPAWEASLEEVGIDGFLQKPFRAREVAFAVKTARRSRSGASADEGSREERAGDSSAGESGPDTPASTGNRTLSRGDAPTDRPTDAPSPPDDGFDGSRRVIDRNRLFDRADAYAVEPERIATSFARDVETFLTALDDAVDDADATAVRDACHDLRTSADLVGATHLSRLLRRVDEEEHPVDGETILSLRLHCRAASDAVRSAV